MGELWVTTAPGAPRLVEEDAVFLRAIAEIALEAACDAPAGPGSPALVLCDIDDVKHVNDTGGHTPVTRRSCVPRRR